MGRGAEVSWFEFVLTLKEEAPFKEKVIGIFRRERNLKRAIVRKEYTGTTYFSKVQY